MILFIVDLKNFFLNSLKKKQLIILLEAKNFNGKITNLARKISEKQKIPLSTVWHNLRILKKKGLINFLTNYHLTQLGVMLVQVAVDQQEKTKLLKDKRS